MEENVSLLNEELEEEDNSKAISAILINILREFIRSCYRSDSSAMFDSSFQQIQEVLSGSNHLSKISIELEKFIWGGEWVDNLYSNVQIQAFQSLTSFEDIDRFASSSASIIEQAMHIISKVLGELSTLLLSTSLTVQLPQASHYSGKLASKSEALKEKLKTLKLQYKISPGVQLPPIKVITKEIVNTLPRVVTEWETFTYEEIIEIETQRYCSYSIVGRCFQPFSTMSKEAVEYHAPIGWEVIRANASIVDGEYRHAQIGRTRMVEHKAITEVLIRYSKMAHRLAWCKVRMEGLLSRSRVVEAQEVTQKTVLVMEDQYGSYELPEQYLEYIL